MRGALFENWVIIEMLKGHWNLGKQANLYFWRSHIGHEIDVLVDGSENLIPIEVKSGQTVASDWFRELHQWCEMAGQAAGAPTLVYGGDRRHQRLGVDLVPWREVGDIGRAVMTRSRHSGKKGETSEPGMRTRKGHR